MALAILQFIPLSLAAITPTMIIFVTALLAHDGNGRRALAVVIGRYVGLLVAGYAMLFLLHQVPRDPVAGKLDDSEVLPTIFVVVGIVLMVAAAYTLSFGSVPSEKNQSSVLDRLRHLHAPLLFLACLVTVFVSIRQLSLLLAGIAIIKESVGDWGSAVILLVILCVFMIWPMLVPLGIKYGMGERGDEMLRKLRDWMNAHQRGINALVLAFFGGILVAKGIEGLY